MNQALRKFMIILCVSVTASLEEAFFILKNPEIWCILNMLGNQCLPISYGAARNIRGDNHI